MLVDGEVIGKSAIFMVETKNEIQKLNGRLLCAAESAAMKNPENKVTRP